MLTQLRLRDFVLIERAEFFPVPGFCALTGETGVGKSVLVDALSLLCGARAGGDRVRPGCERAEIEAAFDLSESPALCARLRDDGLDDGDGLIVRRIVSRDARMSRAFINGRAAGLSQLSEVASTMVDICGQHAHHALRNASAHGDILDDFAGARPLAEKVAAQWRLWRDAAEALAAAEKESGDNEARRAMLTEGLVELEALQFSGDKWTETNRRLSRLESASDLASGCDEAMKLLGDDESGGGGSGSGGGGGSFGGSGGARESLARAKRILESLAAKDESLASPAGLASAALDAANEAARELDIYAGELKPDPAAQAEAESFVSEAHRLARKHRLPGPESLGEHIAKLRDELSELNRRGDLAEMRKAEAESRRGLDSLCKKLTATRTRAAKRFAEEATRRLRALAMPEAEISAALTPADPPRSGGAERVEFLVTTRSDAAPGPLSRVASGGELSRVALAAQATAGRARPTPVTVFDEIDAGVGGAAAAAVGAALAELGESRQVLCVTHLAQVAARAGAHWRVQAARKDGRRSAVVQRVEGDDRIAEVARMLGGAKTTEAAKRHAAEMLEVR